MNTYWFDTYTKDPYEQTYITVLGLVALNKDSSLADHQLVALTMGIDVSTLDTCEGIYYSLKTHFLSEWMRLEEARYADEKLIKQIEISRIKRQEEKPLFHRLLDRMFG